MAVGSCKKCHKPIGDKRHNLCRACYLKISLRESSPNWKGGPPKCEDCGKELSYACKKRNIKLCKKCLGKRLSGEKRYNWVPNKDRFCQDCGKLLSRAAKYVDTKRCGSCAHKGDKNINYGKMPNHGKGNYYHQIYMRSSYEIAYAHYLDLRGIKWLYEIKTFILEKNNTYTPDFYLPETDEYIEIKGWWRDKAKDKFEEFKNLYKTIKISVLEKHDLKNMEVLK